MHVPRNASILVALRLAFSGAMAGGVDATRILPNVGQQTTQVSGKLTSTPASTSTSTPTSTSTSTSPPSAPFSPVQVRRVRYTCRDGARSSCAPR